MNNKRLFENDQLYCEGRERTHLRGWFHFLMCISFFPMLLSAYLYQFYYSDKTNISYISFIACTANIIIIYVAHCISAYYHIKPLSLEDEIFFQKLDITGANLYVASSYLPMSVVLPYGVSALLLGFVSLLVGFNINGIIASNYSMLQPAFICILQFIFGYYLYHSLNKTEIALNLIGIFSLIIGSAFLFNQWHVPLVDEAYFNYFEVYHGFSVICLITICLMNYSIFKRTFTTNNN